MLDLARRSGPLRALLAAPALNPLMAAGPEAWAEVAARRRRARDSGSPTSSCTCPSRSPTTSTSTRRSSTRPTSGASSAPTSSRCCRTGATCPSATTAAPARSSPSGTPIVRPSGQAKPPDADAPRFGPSRRLDIELELGFVIGLPEPRSASPCRSSARSTTSSGSCSSTTGARATSRPGSTLPLGPFLGKSFATSIGHWVLPLAALADRRVAAPPQEPEPLPYLREEPWAFDLPLEVELNGDGRRRARTRATSTGASPSRSPT